MGRHPGPPRTATAPTTKDGLIPISTAHQNPADGSARRPGSTTPAREQIREASFALFELRGIRSVGVDELIEASGVAKATFYKHFRSKDELTLAYLDHLYRRRKATLTLAVGEGACGPQALLGIFDALDAVPPKTRHRGSSFVCLLIESGGDTAVGQACADYLALLRDDLAQMASTAGARRPAQLARGLHFIIRASLMSAVEGDLDGLTLGRVLAAQLIALDSSGEEATAVGATAAMEA